MEKLLEHGIYVAPGLNGSVAAVGKSLRWLDARGNITAGSGSCQPAAVR